MHHCPTVESDGKGKSDHQFSLKKLCKQQKIIHLYFSFDEKR